MTTPTVVSPPAVFLLASIREVLELAGVKEAIDDGTLCPKLLEISPQEIEIENKNGKKSRIPLEAPDGYPEFDMTMRKALNSKICPIVSVAGPRFNHAMCAYELSREKIGRTMVSKHSLTYMHSLLYCISYTCYIIYSIESIFNLIFSV